MVVTHLRNLVLADAKLGFDNRPEEPIHQNDQDRENQKPKSRADQLASQDKPFGCQTARNQERIEWIQSHEPWRIRSDPDVTRDVVCNPQCAH